MKRNVPVLGLFLGLLFPLLGMLAMYLVRFSNMSVAEFFKTIFDSPKVGAMILSLGLIANLIPFLFYTSRRLDLTARGVLVATMLYAVLIIILRFELLS
ncbi:MAG: hypothetical protein EOP49_13950 [Sphingobacteriales bacterium]|nr:MAG: hypothetical protein EOP49_13950 [Sphingobacteriales bacterium]